jgi:hypothetical protein
VTDIALLTLLLLKRTERWLGRLSCHSDPL